MRPPRFIFAACVFVAILGLAALGAWLALSESDRGPLRVKVMKVNMVMPYPGAGFTDSTPHEKVEIELTNKSSHDISYASVILRSDASPGKVLGTDSSARGSRYQLKPGESTRLTLIAYDRHRTEKEWNLWRPRLFYRWEYAGQPLRKRIRQWYNNNAQTLGLKYKIQLPRAATAFHSTLPGLEMPPVAPFVPPAKLVSP